MIEFVSVVLIRTTDVALRADCPVCGAVVGASCRVVGSHGPHRERSPHMLRRSAAITQALLASREQERRGSAKGNEP